MWGTITRIGPRGFIRSPPIRATSLITSIASNFVFAQQGEKGNVGRDPRGAFGPGVNNWDLSFSKNFPFGERYRFQFRWEMYNAFNRVSLASPNATLNNGQFGLINSTNSNFPSRVMQVAGKLYF